MVTNRKPSAVAIIVIVSVAAVLLIGTVHWKRHQDEARLQEELSERQTVLVAVLREEIEKYSGKGIGSMDAVLGQAGGHDSSWYYTGFARFSDPEDRHDDTKVEAALSCKVNLDELTIGPVLLEVHIGEWQALEDRVRAICAENEWPFVTVPESPDP